MIDFHDITIADYDELIAFWKAQPGIGLNESDGRESMAAYLARNPGFSLAARDNGTLIGAVLCGHEGRRGYLHHLAVAPSHRGRGIGSALVQKCLTSLGAAGIAKCNIFVYAANDDGRRFWSALGFAIRDDLQVSQRATITPEKPPWEPIELHTDRLILREFSASDLDAIQAYAADPEVLRFMDWGPNTLEQTRAFLARAIADAQQTPRVEYSLAVALRRDGTLIGGCRLTLRGERNLADVGYVYHRAHWGNGYATETMRAMLRFGFERLGLHRIDCRADVRNVASWRVMEKVGMQREAHLREHEQIKGEWRSSYLYAILDREWRANREANPPSIAGT